MAHSSEWLKFTAEDFTELGSNSLSDYTHIFQYFSDWIDSIQASVGGDTWRPIQVNGSEAKGSNIGTGYINFGGDDSHNVNFSYDNNTIMANVNLDLSGYVPTSRKINNKALTSDITLTYSDVGAASSSHTHSNYVTIDTDQSITGLKTFTQRPLSNSVYTQLEYIESQATPKVFPYIKTGVRRGTTYSDTDSLSCVFDGYFTASQTLGFFGYDGGGQLGQRNGYWSTEGGNSNVSALTRATVLQVINFSGNYDRLYIGGSQIATRAISTAASYSINGDYPLFVAYSGNYTYQPAKARLYSFKMYIGDYYTSPSSCTLIRDFIPAKSPTGEIGLLDLVENKFYVNSGTENFIAGPDVTTVTTASPLVITTDVSKVGFSNNYNDLDNKPSIPYVYNGTITLQQNGTTVDSFTLNQSNSKTINFTTPTKDSDLTNDRYVRYDATQSLTADQQATARSNIGAGTSNFTGYTASNKLSTNYINNVAGWTAVTESTVNNWGFTKNIGTVTSVDSISPSSGNVALSAVRYVSQSLTDAQKTQARTNIGAGTSNFTGYTSSNKLSTDYINNVAGWTSNIGTVTSVNQKLPSDSGDVTIGVSDIQGLGSTLTQLNNTVIQLGSDIAEIASDIPTKDSDLTNDRYVRYDNTQSLTTDQQTQARTNIGAGTSNFTGYSLTNQLSGYFIDNVQGWTSNTGTVSSVNHKSPGVNGNVTIGVDDISGLGSTLTQLSNDIANRVSYDDIQTTDASDSTKIPTIAYVEDMIGSATSPITDTKNTTGATPNGGDLFLVGASDQTENPVTYTNSGLKWYGNRAALQIQGAHTGAYYSADSIITYLTTATNTTHTFTWPDLSSLGTTTHTIPIQFQYKTATGQDTVAANSQGMVDLTGINPEAIEDVAELPVGSAINEHKFYRLTTIGEEIIVPIPSDNTTAFSNVVFNDDLSDDEVISIVTNTSIAYTDISAEQSPIDKAFKIYNINHGNYQKKYQYSIVWVSDLDLALICNRVMAESISSGSSTGDEQLIWTNNGNVLAELLQLGTSLPDGWDPMGTGILDNPIAPIYFLNNDTETHESNGLLKNLVYCTKITDTLKIKEIYEDGVADTSHTQYIKSNLGTLKLNVVNTMPATVNTALSLVYSGLANYTIWATPNNNYGIVALFVENTNATTVTPYLLAALISDEDSDNPTINTSYAAIGPAGTVMSNFSGETYGTITADVELIKNIVLYHHKEDNWYDVGSGLDPRFVVGTTAEIAAMSEDELQGKVVILTDETENYKSTLEAIQEQVSSAMVNVAHISDIPQLEINGVATNRINIQTGITDGFTKSISWTNDDWVQSGQISADSNNNIDITDLINEITSQVTRNYQSQELTNTSQTWENILVSWPYQFHYVYEYATGTNNYVVWLDTTHWTGVPRFDVTSFLLGSDIGPIGAQRKSVIALNDDIYNWTPETLVTEQGSIFSSITTHSSNITDPQLYHNTGGSLSIIQSVILRNTNAATDYQVLVPNVANVVDMSPWFESLPNVVTAAGQTLGANTIVLGSGSQKVKSSNYTITSDSSHITGSASTAANEVPTAAAVHDAIATVNNLRASYSSGILTLTVE